MITIKSLQIMRKWVFLNIGLPITQAVWGRDFIGNPKQSALFGCELVDGEYVKTLFRGNNLIVSRVPQLNLTAH